MPRRIQNITDEAYQRHTILLAESEMILELRFCTRVQSWFMNLEHADWIMNGIKVSVGVRHLESASRPVDFVCQDRSNNGLDPFRIDDFSTGRCELHLLDEDDVLSLALGEELS